MKIYNKKTFLAGVFWLILGVSLLIAGIFEAFTLKRVLLLLAAFLFAFGSLRRSTSRKMSLEDKREALDERNQWIEQKSKSLALNIMQGGTFVLMFVCLIVGSLHQENLLLGMGLGMGFCFSLSLFAEMGATLYYEFHS